LGALPAPQVSPWLDQLEERSFPRGATIIREGEAGDQLYIIKSGDVRVSEGQQPEERGLKLLGSGDYFGERALICDQPRAASVVPGGHRLLQPQRPHFEACCRSRLN